MLHQRKRKKSKGAKICKIKQTQNISVIRCPFFNSAKNFLEKCKPKEDS